MEAVDRIKYLEELRAIDRKRKQARLSRARSNYKDFAEYVLKDEQTGGNIKMAPIHKQWIRHINFAWSNGLNCAILAPYGHGKTANCAIGVPLFLLGVDPSIRILMVSANDKIARERLVLVRQYIDNSEEYHEVFPNVQADPEMGWTKSELYLKRQTYAKDASLSAAGGTSSGIGKRIDILILDDINDAKNTLHQPKMREVIWRNFTGVYLSRLEKTSKVLIIATRWHEQDLIGQIMSDESMRTKYAFLIQRITEDFQAIETETIIPGGGSTGPIYGKELAHLFELYEEGII